MPENYSHVRSGGRGKRQASRKPGGSQLHIKPAGCYLEPVASEHATTTRTTTIAEARRFRVWAIYAIVNGNETRVTQFAFPRLADATAHARNMNDKDARANARVQPETVWS